MNERRAGMDHEHYDWSPTVAVDAMTARHYGYLMRHLVEYQYELVAHGISASRMISSRMSEDEERAYIAESIAALRDVSGRLPSGRASGSEIIEAYRRSMQDQ